MDTTQAAETSFFVPVAAAYLIACAGWLVASRLGSWWQGAREITTERSTYDLVLALAATLAILLLGQLWRLGFLLPQPTGRWVEPLTWNINNLIIYSPIAATLLYRRQPLDTVFMSVNRLGQKILAGLLLGLAGVAVFLIARGQMAAFSLVLAQAVSGDALRNFLPVFLEGVAIAFLFVRLRWRVGLLAALFIPSILFAAAHVPRAIADGRSVVEISAFFAFNTVLVAGILYVIARSRDVVWIGLVHYLLDVATGAFN